MQAAKPAGLDVTFHVRPKMRGITESSVCLSAAVLAAAIAAACSQSPTRPTTTGASSLAGAAADAQSEQGSTQSWQEFAARGWNCRTPNNGPVTVCSPPNQPLPVVALPPAVPPDDRPETVLLKRWRDGVFDANVLLIRPEIYNGQICASTGERYSYIGVLGYFECAHGRAD